MLIYFLKRILYFVPTLLIISIIAFVLSRLTPGDPVVQLCGDPFQDEKTGFIDYQQAERQYEACAQLIGRDRPWFYFSLVPLAYPDTLHRELRKYRRRTLRRLLQQYGDWPEIQTYYRSIREAEYALPDYRGRAEVQNRIIDMRSSLRQLYLSHREPRIHALLHTVDTLSAGIQSEHDSLASAIGFDTFRSAFDRLSEHYEAVQVSATPWKLWIPTFCWYGFKNQYHRWFAGLWRGDFGISFKDRQPVLKKIWQAARWTLIINLIAVMLSFGLAIPLGVWSASRQGSRFDHGMGLLLFMLYSLPAFWVATLLIIFLTTPEYGRWLDWFPTAGLGGMDSGAGLWERVLDFAWHITLPVFCLTYGSLAVIARQMRGSMLDVMEKPFVLTARAKGAEEGRVIWRHAFRNALFPIITLIGSVVPALLAGSVIIEFIFSIPGMGQLTYQSIVGEDWPVVFAVLLIAAFLTMLGNLLADLLYAWSDPRVSYTGKN